VDKHGKDTFVAAFAEVQDYVGRLTRRKVSELPDGTWETEDCIKTIGVAYRRIDPPHGEPSAVSSCPS